MNLNDYLYKSLQDMKIDLSEEEQKQASDIIEKLANDMQPIYSLVESLKKDEKQFHNFYIGLKKFLRGKKDG